MTTLEPLSTNHESPLPMTMKDEERLLCVKDLSVSYSKKVALRNVNFYVNPNTVTALIGPSGCGKSTLLRSINRMNDYVTGAQVTGQVLFHGVDITSSKIDEVKLRTRIGMVFQKANPFPRSILDNIRWGLRIHSRPSGMDVVEAALRSAFLWDEVKDKLQTSALSLSGGQQQRLCIARALALEPEVLLMDEPCSALDPIATAKIEELIRNIKNMCTVLIVTHNLQQARRLSDETAFLYQGDLIEVGPTDTIFTHPKKPRTSDYVNGRFG